MVKQVKSRKAAGRGLEFSGREIWLAGLGAAALTSKQGVRLYAALREEGAQLQARVDRAVRSVRTRLEETAQTVRERADSALGEVRGRLEARLQPVLSRLGVRKASARGTRTQARKSGVRRATAPRRGSKAA